MRYLLIRVLVILVAMCSERCVFLQTKQQVSTVNRITFPRAFELGLSLWLYVSAPHRLIHCRPIRAEAVPQRLLPGRKSAPLPWWQARQPAPGSGPLHICIMKAEYE